jgi:hypothetical protein
MTEPSLATRIATPHGSLQRAVVEKRSTVDFPLPPIDSSATARQARRRRSAVGAGAALSDGRCSKRFALTKKTITVGRGPQCDLQILTYSRVEHARVTLSGDATGTEDLAAVTACCQRGLADCRCSSR